MMNLKICIRCLLKLRKQNLIFKLLIPLIQAQVKRKKKKTFTVQFAPEAMFPWFNPPVLCGLHNLCELK